MTILCLPQYPTSARQCEGVGMGRVLGSDRGEKRAVDALPICKEMSLTISSPRLRDCTAGPSPSAFILVSGGLHFPRLRHDSSALTQMHPMFLQTLQPLALRLRQDWVPFLASLPCPQPNNSSAECKLLSKRPEGTAWPLRGMLGCRGTCGGKLTSERSALRM